MEEKMMEEPKEPFHYIAGRPYLPTRPAEEKYCTESLTEEKGDSIAECLGECIDIQFYKSIPWDRKYKLEGNKTVITDETVVGKRAIREGDATFVHHPLYSLSARLKDFAKIKVNGAAKGAMYEPLDWVYLFAFQCMPPADALDTLSGSWYMEHFDLGTHLKEIHANGSSVEAYQWQAAYWKKRNMGLIVDISLPGKEVLFSTEADLFSPRSFKPISASFFVLSLYSHRPDLLEEMFKRGYGRKPLSREIPPPSIIFNDKKNDTEKLEEILNKIPGYRENKGVSQDEIMHRLTPFEQAVLLPITTEIVALKQAYSYQPAGIDREEEDLYEILSLIDTLRDEYIAVKEACGESPWDHWYLREAFPGARDFFKHRLGEPAGDFAPTWHENFVLIEYSIQERKAQLRKKGRTEKERKAFPITAKKKFGLPQCLNIIKKR